MILLFNLSQHPLLPVIKETAKDHHKVLRLISPEENRLPIRALLDPSDVRDPLMPKLAEDLIAPDSFDAPMMLFCKMKQDEISSFVDRLRELSNGGSARILKAMLTPTNQNWTAPYLYAHLREEARMMRRNS
ncbi:MAG: DUF3783 domain-containing protein [Firmicutes bacterium]|nr:DUF3783 domain-containing protein [Bacillota bacterium]